MSNSKDIRVILVDDEESLVDYLAKRLLREGFTVRATTSGEEAVEAASREDFDVAIVDLKMPGMGGLETQRLLRDLRPFIQIIILTGHGSIDSALESGRHDAFRYYQKPLEHGELVAAIVEAAELKRETQYTLFRKEMEEITSMGGSPREIRAAIEEARRRYGIE